MALINLTPHAIQVYGKAGFVNLEQVNPTTWIADGVEGDPISSLSSRGMARISTITSEVKTYVEGCPVVQTEYGLIEGLPEELSAEDYLVVSLPTQQNALQSGHPLATAGMLLAPYGVVRKRDNGSIVLGCMGFTQPAPKE